jgi:hypothetical protein
MNHLDYRQPTASAPSHGALPSRRASTTRSAVSSRSMSRAWLLSLGLMGVAVAEPAWAAPTESCNLDCPLGTTCEFAPVACPAIACAEDSPDCPRCDSSAEGTPYCAPAACESDSECADSMKCAEFVIECANGLPLAAPAARNPAPSCPSLPPARRAYSGSARRAGSCPALPTATAARVSAARRASRARCRRMIRAQASRRTAR